MRPPLAERPGERAWTVHCNEKGGRSRVSGACFRATISKSENHLLINHAICRPNKQCNLHTSLYNSFSNVWNAVEMWTLCIHLERWTLSVCQSMDTKMDLLSVCYLIRATLPPHLSNTATACSQHPWSFFPPLFCPTAPNTTWLHIYFCLCLPTRISAPWEEDLCLGSPIAIVISSLVSFKPSDPICCISVLWASHCSFSLRGFHKFRAVLGIGELKLFLPMYSWNSHLPSHRPIPHCV